MVDAPENGEYTAASPSQSDETVFATDAVDDASAEAEDEFRRLLLVALFSEVVAVPAGEVVEVLTARPYARIPGAPDAVAGIANRRGRMLTVIDLGLALDTPATATGGEHRIVVVSYGGRELGLAVKDVLQITTEWWSEPAGSPESEDGVDAGRHGGSSGGSLRVVELDSVFDPLFGGDTAKENQLQDDHELNRTDL